MKVTRFNPKTDESVTLDLDVENQEWAAYQAGIQLEVAAPRLTGKERIWVKTGVLWSDIIPAPTPDQLREKLHDSIRNETPTSYFPDSL